MKIGFCARLDRIEEVALAGFDYLEAPVSAMAAWTEEEYRAQAEKVKQAAIPVPRFNVLFPGEMALLAEGTTNQQIMDYLQLVLPRVAGLGGRVVVFGSGRSRTRQEKMTYGAAWRRLVEVTRLVGEAAVQHGVTIVIEPLNRGETNMINSVAEGACLVATVNHPAVKLLADYYHVAMENQPPEDLTRLDGIAHAHVATKEGRKAPMAPDEGIQRMFSAMKQTGYQGFISVEGALENMAEQGPQCVAVLKKMWTEA